MNYDKILTMKTQCAPSYWLFVMRKPVEKMCPRSFLFQNHKMGILLRIWIFCNCFSVFFPFAPCSEAKLLASFRRFAFGIFASQKRFLYCSCNMPINHRSGINGRDDCLCYRLIIFLTAQTKSERRREKFVIRFVSFSAKTRKNGATAAEKLLKLICVWTYRILQTSNNYLTSLRKTMGFWFDGV